MILRKLAPDGAILWQTSYPGTPYLLHVDDNLNVYICGIDSTDENTIIIKYSQVTGIQTGQSEVAKLVVTPNPFNNAAILALPPLHSTYVLEWFDLPGRKLRSESIKPLATHTLQRNGLQEGMYTLRLVSEGQIIGTAKIVIQ